MYIAEISDRIYTVDEEETAKYVEPKGIFAKIWDWISEYHNHSPPKTCAHYVFLTSVKHCTMLLPRPIHFYL
jgi:hypothetical protein